MAKASDIFKIKLRVGRKKLLQAATILVMLPILIVTVKNVGHSITTVKKLSQIDKDAKAYQQSITADSLTLEQIRYDEGLERFAREKFFMQRQLERVYVIEE